MAVCILRGTLAKGHRGDLGAVETEVDLFATGQSSVVAGEQIGLKPELEVLQDYDDYFRNYVLALVDQKAKSALPFESKKIVVDSGPWRMYDVSHERNEDTLLVDFYSPSRFRGGPDTGVEELLRAL